LSGLFIDNFDKFADTDEGKKLVVAGPQLLYASLPVPKGTKRGRFTPTGYLYADCDGIVVSDSEWMLPD